MIRCLKYYSKCKENLIREQIATICIILGDALDPAIGKIYLNMYRTEKDKKVLMTLKNP